MSIEVTVTSSISLEERQRKLHNLRNYRRKLQRERKYSKLPYIKAKIELATLERDLILMAEKRQELVEKVNSLRYVAPGQKEDLDSEG